jgi:hypothetical protein
MELESESATSHQNYFSVSRRVCLYYFQNNMELESEETTSHQNYFSVPRRVCVYYFGK